MTETDPNIRLEAFCDGVLAIALTLLIIDIKIPSTVEINNTADFWIAISHIAPSILTFILSFMIILITWVNHHNCLKLVNKSSASFIYANGFVLLTVVFIPFPTSLVGEFILTDFAAPAVFLYNAVLALHGIAWIFIAGAALNNQLTKNEKATAQMRTNRRNAFFAFILYSMLAIIALWFPLTIAIVTTLTWIFWLIFGVNMKHE